MRVKLKDVCEKATSNLKQSDILSIGGTYPVYGASGYLGNIDSYHQDKPYIAVVKDGAGIGRTTILPPKSSVIGTMQYLIPKENVMPEYLYYVVKHMRLQKYYTGATIPHIYFKDYQNEEFNLADSIRQREIVKVLKNVEDTIRYQEIEINKFDELIKARFIEMFGDPVSNSKHLPLKTLPQLGTFGRGVSKYRPRNAPELLNGPYPLIQTGDIANSELYIKNYNNTYSEVGLKQSKMWDKGTLCITIAANIFVHYWFSFFQEILENQAPESAQKNINLKILSELQIITPDIIEQNQFADFVRQVDKSRFVELLQDHGIFDLGLNTDEMDTYYNEFLEQVQDQKQEVIDNQEIILTLQDTSLLNVFHEKTNEEIHNELEKEISEMFNGIEGEDASKLYDSLHNQIQYA